MAFSNIILTGGINHDFDDTAAALSEVLEQVGIDSTIFADIDAGFDAINSNSYDLITIFALRWRMLDDDKYIPFRDEWSYEIGQRDRDNLIAHTNSGGGMLGLHTAAICFDTWQQWPRLLGASWQWGTTFHPPPETFTVNIATAHPSTSGQDDFEVEDEIYHNILPANDSIPLLATRSPGDSSMQTLAWAQEFGSGRVIYNALGHDRASVTSEGHARFLQRASLWCCGAHV